MPYSPSADGAAAVTVREVCGTVGVACFGSCARTVTDALRTVAGTESAIVDVVAKRAIVVSSAPVEALVQAVEDVGFGASLLETGRSVELAVEGMVCEKNCGSTVRAALQHVPMVRAALVDVPGNKATILGEASVSSLIDAISAVGFDVHVPNPQDAPQITVANSIQVLIPGLTGSASSQQRVVAAVRKVAAVQDASIDAATGILTVFGSPSAQHVLAAIRTAGFEGSMHTASSMPTQVLSLGGMYCGYTCVETITNALMAVPGVSRATVDFHTQSATVLGSATIDALVEAVESVGYQAQRWVPPPSNLHESKQSADADQEIANLSTIIQIPNAAIGLFSVAGMTCASCVRNVEKNVGVVPGVERVVYGVVSQRHVPVVSWCCGSVSLVAERAQVLFNSEMVTVSEICRIINGLGYKATHLRTESPGDSHLDQCTLVVDGMTCASCVSKIERKLNSLPGVDKASVSLTPGRAAVWYHQNQTGVRSVRISLVFPGLHAHSHPVVKIIDAVVAMGYNAELLHDADDVGAFRRQQAEEVDKWWGRLIRAAIFGVPIILIHMVLMYIPATAMILEKPILFTRLSLGQLLLWLLATPVQFIVGAPMYRSAYNGLRHGSLGMDFLVVTGTTLAYVYSVASVIVAEAEPMFEGVSFFETPGMLFLFIMMGKYMEARAKGSVSEALTALMALKPPTAILLTPGDTPDSYTSKEISADLVQQGDLVKVVPGARVPVDGVVEFGASSVDQSMLTGESYPVRKAVGDDVIGSTINKEGVLHVRATAVGKASTISQILDLITTAQTTKPPIQVFADRVAGMFAPVVIAVAFATFVTWLICSSAGLVGPDLLPPGVDSVAFSLKFAISVIVIACPCALGLATPTAVMVGSSVGAACGVLIKSAPALETAHKVTAIIFDKTGTLTEGRPSVVTTLVARSAQMTTSELVCVAASAEVHSEHPIARAIVTYAERNSITLKPVSNFIAIPGHGLTCTIDSKPMLVGSLDWMQSNGILIPADLQAQVAAEHEQGHTTMCVSLENEVAGIVAVVDPPKPESSAVVAELQRRGIEVWMVTGDNHRTAQVVGSKLGIHNIVSQVLPAQKVAAVKNLQRDGHVVAMVGDGINDSPALTQADVGLGIGAGSGVALESADVVLVKSDLRDVVTALDLSRVVYNRIKLNMLFACVFNVLAIPVAAGVLAAPLHIMLPPEAAAAAMALSSVTVVCSSLLLRRYRPPMSEKPLVEITAGPSPAKANAARRTKRGASSRRSRDPEAQSLV